MNFLKKFIRYSTITLYIFLVGMSSNMMTNIIGENTVILALMTLISYVILRSIVNKLKPEKDKNNLFFYKSCGIPVIFFTLICVILCLIEEYTKEKYMVVLSFIMPSISASMALSFVFAILHLLITNIENIGSNRL